MKTTKENRTVMLIDDDHDDYEIFTMALHEVDSMVSCIYYDSAKVALQKLVDGGLHPPDYIFLDLNMPGMNGLQFLEQIKKTHFAHLPVIIYSTSILPPHKEKISQLGVYRSFVKPFSHSELINILKGILVEN